MRYPEKTIITYDTPRQIDYCQHCQKPECDNCLARLMIGQLPSDEMPPAVYPVTADPCPDCPLSGHCTGNCKRLRSWRKWRETEKRRISYD